MNYFLNCLLEEAHTSDAERICLDELELDVGDVCDDYGNDSRSDDFGNEDFGVSDVDMENFNNMELSESLMYSFGVSYVYDLYELVDLAKAYDKAITRAESKSLKLIAKQLAHKLKMSNKDIASKLKKDAALAAKNKKLNKNIHRTYRYHI